MDDWRDHPYIRMLAETDPAYRRAIDAMADAEGDPAYRRAIDAMADAEGSPSPHESPRPTVAEARADIRRIMACPHWTRPGCGCAQGLCTFAWRRRLVTFDDCRSCLGPSPAR